MCPPVPASKGSFGKELSPVPASKGSFGKELSAKPTEDCRPSQRAPPHPIPFSSAAISWAKSWAALWAMVSADPLASA